MGFIKAIRDYKLKGEEKLFERAEIASTRETELRKKHKIKAARHEKLEEARAKIKSEKEYRSRGRKEFFGKIAKGASSLSKSIGQQAQMSASKSKKYKPMQVKTFKEKKHKTMKMQPYKPW